jgi:pSer/pThr/pTyr-binding forkhead associated (FHA) protein
MRCAQCGFDDPEDLAFCSECGAPRRGAALGDAGPPTGRRPAAASALGFDGSGRAAGGPAPTARLIGLDGALEGVEFALTAPEVGIGRRPDCDIRITEHGVSRLHARLRAERGGYLIEDAGSANGTWVNDACIEGALPLSDGDVIRIGPCSFAYYGGQAGQGSPSEQSLPPGSMTVVADVGQDPSPFGGAPLLNQGPSPPSTPSAFPSPWSEPPARPGPLTPPAFPVPPPAGSPALEGLQAQLGEMARDLAACLQRLDALAAELRATRGQRSGSPSAGAPEELLEPLRDFRDAVAAAGGPEQYAELQALLAELQPSPTDLRLLLRLADQLPLVGALVSAYLSAGPSLDALG